MNSTEKRIWNALNTAQENGFKIVQRNYGVVDESCCPMAAVVLEAAPNHEFMKAKNGFYIKTAVVKASSDSLRKSQHWVTNFIYGWDDHVPATMHGRYKKAWEMGRRLHKRWVSQ